MAKTNNNGRRQQVFAFIESYRQKYAELPPALAIQRRFGYARLATPNQYLKDFQKQEAGGSEKRNADILQHIHPILVANGSQKGQLRKKIIAFVTSFGFLISLGLGTAALAAVTISTTGLTGDSNVSIDGAGTLSIGTASSTAIVIGSSSTPVTIGDFLTLGAASTTGQLLLYNGTSTLTTAIQASSSQANNLTFTLPPTVGSAGNALLTDGAGNLYFGSPSSSSYSGCTSDGSGGITCTGNLTAGSGGSATGEIDLTGKTSDSTVRLLVSDTTGSGTLTLPGATGQVSYVSSPGTSGHFAVFGGDGVGLVDGGGTYSTPALVQLAQCTVGGSCTGTVTGSMGTGTVTFSSIPGTYTTLSYSIWGRSNAAVSTDPVVIQFNSDATLADYSLQNTVFAGTSSGSGSATFTSQQSSGNCTSPGCGVGNLAGTSAPSGFPSQITGSIIGYASNAFYKRTITDAGGSQSGSDDTVGLTTISWSSTSPVTQLEFLSKNASALAAGSTFTLYGVR